ncbi:MAG TPA: FAD-dependent monooxygenase, partial [Propionibacteriaceae bacterium]|nr:FAD-dependent monooxygenase [Propionibacteriaceae bacterium]
MSAPLDHGRSWDVIIIGARVAGASTALLLGRAGMRVLVVERARRGADTVSTHALMRGGVLQLDRWGLLDRVAATGAPPVRRVTFHYGHDSMPVTLKPYAGVDALYAPRRTVLDALLVGAAEEAGARFGFGLAMTDVARDRAGRVVGVVVRDHLGATRTERAGLVVGADGRASQVAQKVGTPTIVEGSHAAAYIYGYWPAANVDGYHWYYGDGLSAGVIPTNDGLACVFVAGPAAVLAARMRHSRPLDAARELLVRLDCR